MKLFTTAQIREIDAYTIQNEPISSIKLIERVAKALFVAFQKTVDQTKKIAVIAGKGNNGSDGLALAILLKTNGYDVTVYSYESTVSKPETQFYLSKLEANSIETFLHSGENDFDVIIDGLFGTGISKPITGLELQIIESINKADSHVISIDIPSGMNADSVTSAVVTGVVKADYTFTLEFPKLAFMFPENGAYIGELSIIPISLNKAIIDQLETPYTYTTSKDILIKERERFAHKGTYGHVLIVAGSRGKMGACVLSTKASLRIGAGLVTAHIPECGVDILQISVPEAMAHIDTGVYEITEIPELLKINSVCIGPGIGTEIQTQLALIDFITKTKQSLILDADALNCIALQNALDKIPQNTIITPHVKEFERLFGTSIESVSRLQMQVEYSKKLQIYIVLKGYRTSITTPQGEAFFNSTGNPGMATAGSGDVLSGIITGLLAQGYNAQEACLFGVYIHGLAGDFASDELSENCLNAGDIISFIPKAQKYLLQSHI